MWGDLKRDLGGRDGAGDPGALRGRARAAPEIPPRRELGDLAFPAALQLARVLKRPPREIAQDAGRRPPAAGVGGRHGRGRRLPQPPPRADPLAAAGCSRRRCRPGGRARRPKIIVEHTNINPNKAAHIGHLRNAVLGRHPRARRCAPSATRSRSRTTSTTPASRSPTWSSASSTCARLVAAEVAALPEPFDYYCWDLYAEVGRCYAEDPTRQAAAARDAARDGERRGRARRAGPAGGAAVVRRHLATMRRLGIGYDLLTRESDILRLHFFERAFELLKESGAVRLETEGKNAGCWVMPLAESAGVRRPGGPRQGDRALRRHGDLRRQGHRLPALEVRPAGPRLRLPLLARGGGLGDRARGRGADHPAFGGAERVVNVIDARQSYLQKIVARRPRGARPRASRRAASVHFAYEMVALSPATARQLGVEAATTRRGAEPRRRQGARDVGTQGHRRQGRRPARPARGEGAATRSRSATASSGPRSWKRWHARSPPPRCASSWSRGHGAGEPGRRELAPDVRGAHQRVLEVGPGLALEVERLVEVEGDDPLGGRP